MSTGNRSRLFTTLLAFSASVHAAQAQITPILIDTLRGGEVYAPGQQQTVVLNAKTTASSILIEVSLDGGATFETLGTINSKNHLGAANRLSWTVAFPATTNSQLRATSFDPHYLGERVFARSRSS